MQGEKTGYKSLSYSLNYLLQGAVNAQHIELKLEIPPKFPVLMVPQLILAILHYV